MLRAKCILFGTPGYPGVRTKTLLLYKIRRACGGCYSQIKGSKTVMVLLQLLQKGLAFGALPISDQDANSTAKSFVLGRVYLGHNNNS